MPVWEQLWAFSFGEIKTLCMNSGELVFPEVALYPSAILSVYSDRQSIRGSWHTKLWMTTITANTTGPKAGLVMVWKVLVWGGGSAIPGCSFPNLCCSRRRAFSSLPPSGEEDLTSPGLCAQGMDSWGRSYSFAFTWSGETTIKTSMWSFGWYLKQMLQAFGSCQ